jgi:hypothetical protein
MATRINDQKASVEQVDPIFTLDQMTTDKGVCSALEPAPTAQELLEAWDLDILHQGFIRPGLKPLTANELESLITKFPDVMPQVYVRPNVILLETEAKEGYLMEVARQDLSFSGEVPIQILYARGRLDVWKWCGGIGRTVDLLSFNKLRFKAVRQTLAPLPRRRRLRTLS